MKKLSMLVILMIAVLSCYSQGGLQIKYPIQLKVGYVISEPCIGISVSQMKDINIVRVERDSYKEISDSLDKEVGLLKNQVQVGKSLIANLNAQLTLKDSLIYKTNEEKAILTDENKGLKKSLEKEKGVKTVIYVIGGTIITALTGVIIYQGVK